MTERSYYINKTTIGNIGKFNSTRRTEAIF